jgi:glyoxylase-like metal-dependent hydrolase (beta-lactamase superfamily II)
MLTFPFPETPALGSAILIAPGVYWIRMPMPVPPGHINVWALSDGAGWTLVDTGYDCEEARTAWLMLKGGVLANKPVYRVIVTHSHQDHCGLAEWLTALFACPLLMSQAEFLTCRLAWALAAYPVTSEIQDFYRQAGVPESLIKNIRPRPRPFSVPLQFSPVHQGDRLVIGSHEWRVVVGRGHSPEHVSLYCNEINILISGDQVLPHMLVNVSVIPESPQANTLKEWISSLEQFKSELPSDTLILPSHELPFIGISERIARMIEIYERTMARICASASEPTTAYQLLEVVYSRIPDTQLLPFSLGSVLAYLHLLESRGILERSKTGHLIRFRRIF